MTDTRGWCDAGACTLDTTSYGYDLARRLTSVTTTYGGTTREVGYGYDEANNRTTLTYPDLPFGSTYVTYTYDEQNRMKLVQPNWISGATFMYGPASAPYDAAGRLGGVAYPSATGLNVSYGYDAANRLTNVTNAQGGTQLSAYTYVPDPNGNRTSVQLNSNPATAYGYDALNRLHTVTNGGNTTTYGYDGVGNRTSISNPATTYGFDAADQLTTLNNANNYTFDQNGNLLLIGSDRNNTFLYDQENRLFRTGPCRGDVNGSGMVDGLDLSVLGKRFLTSQGGGGYDLAFDLNEDGLIDALDLSIAGKEFLKSCASTGPNTGNERNYFNGDGLRVRAVTFPSGGVTTDDSTWDQGAGLPVVLEDTSSGASGTTKYVYGLGLLAKTDGAGTTSYYLTDGLGSTIDLRDASGNEVESYTYDERGVPQSQPSQCNNAFRYTGQQDDCNANRGLYYLRARFYDPALGRFLSKDLLPFEQPYGYVGDDPTALTDPAGLCALSWNPGKYADCPRKFIQRHPGVQRDIVLGADVAAIGFTGASAIITDVATVVGCSAGPEGCLIGYGLGLGATAEFRYLGNAASDLSTIVGCIKGKEGNGRFAKNCGISVAGSFLGATFRDPNIGVGLDIHQFCRDLGRCGWP